MDPHTSSSTANDNIDGKRNLQWTQSEEDCFIYLMEKETKTARNGGGFKKGAWGRMVEAMRAKWDGTRRIVIAEVAVWNDFIAMAINFKCEEFETKLKSNLVQLQIESDIFDRLLYKNRNQHRRCQYFQWLMRVRRDLKLFKSAGLEDIINSFFQAVNGKKPTLKVHLLERLKKKRNGSGRRENIQERLLGVGRLLAQMVEPIIKAGIQISSLLAQSFFMALALTILAVLARLRVLLQQILLDVVSIFNMLSSLSCKEQCTKIYQKGTEVLVDYYLPNEEFLTLECVWEGDKFRLREIAKEGKKMNPDQDPIRGRENSQRTQIMKYRTIGALDNGSDQEDEVCDEIIIHGDLFIEETNPSSIENGNIVGLPSSTESQRAESKVERETKMAFISVRKANPSEAKENSPRKRARTEV
ncbi:uncharacterized protein LOC18422181 isoform X2 [Amborella trichopoda]|uniref:uncharacterized protein LOC18422181 isoform X2 n=1 Tax=Amborella trichopoda TaxID=13333 RepID=UPI0009BF282D|nr:uncharacterized protein LOC18422181 isoform X2 [Amborella trichopoda]|eukprot:XP_020519556.1 uncharacterized protein LOC18422181 isoform X2 [Amborella trichopoda]